MTADLVEFLRARLNEDSGYARHAATEAGTDWRTPASGVLETADDLHGLGDSRLTSFISRFDPGWVLAEVAAKRSILDECAAAIESGEIQPGTTWNDMAAGAELAVDVLQLLAAPYASHPDYQAAWSPTNAVTP